MIVPTFREWANCAAIAFRAADERPWALAGNLAPSVAIGVAMLGSEFSEQELVGLLVSRGQANRYAL